MVDAEDYLSLHDFILKVPSPPLKKAGKENPTKLTCHHFLEGKGPQSIQPPFLLLQTKREAPYLEQAPVSMTSLALVLESLKSEGQDAK